MNRFDILWVRVKAEFPNAKIISREQSTLMSVVFWFVRHVLRQRTDYSSDFTTTILQRMYVPSGFYHWKSDDKYRLLRHELKHMRQARYWPFSFLGPIPILRYVNAFLFMFCYLLAFPVKLTMRSKFEQEGYAQTMLTSCELGWLDPSNDSQREAWEKFMEHTFASGTYFFMAREGVGTLFARRTFEAIASGELTNPRDRVDLRT